MRLILGAAVLCISLGAKADTLPAWLSAGGELRTRLENTTGINYDPAGEDTALLTRIRLELRVKPVSWFSTSVQVQDARGLFTTRRAIRTSYQDTASVRLIYFDAGSLETGPAALRVGRQELLYGDQRMIGYNGWRNTGQSFDAVRVRLRSAANWIDIFAAGAVEVHSDAWNRRLPGQNLYGVYASVTSLAPGLTVEPYVLWTLHPAIAASRQIGGIRSTGKFRPGWEYNTEVAIQTGSVGTNNVRAWGGHWEVSCKRRLFAEYNYAGGDADPKDRRYGTFEPPYPSVHDRLGLADQVGWRNIHHLRAGARIPLTRHVDLLASWHNYHLASRFDALYLPNGRTVARSLTGTAGRYVGNEPDVSALWTPTTGLQLSAGYARMIPGEFLKKAAPGAPLNYVFVMADFVFGK